MVVWTINLPFAFSLFMIGVSAACCVYTETSQHGDSKPAAQESLQATHLHMYALVLWNLLREPPSLIDRARRHLVLGDNPVGDSDPVILVSERRCLVDDTGTGGGLDVGVADDAERFVLELMGCQQTSNRVSLQQLTRVEPGSGTHLFREVIEHRGIPPPLHILSQNLLHHLIPRLLGVLFLPARQLLIQRPDELLEQDEVLLALDVQDLDVGEGGVDTEGKVGGERPGGGCPRQEGGFGLVDEGEGDCYWRFQVEVKGQLSMTFEPSKRLSDPFNSPAGSATSL